MKGLDRVQPGSFDGRVDPGNQSDRHRYDKPHHGPEHRDGEREVERRIDEQPQRNATEDTYKELNWDSISLDIEASESYTISVNCIANEGAETDSFSVSGSAGTNTEFRRLAMKMIGRFMKVTVSVPYGVRLNRVFAGLRRRLRRAT